MEQKALITVDHTEFGLEEVKAKEVAAVFLPMIAKMNELENEYNNVKKLEISKVTCKTAHTLRMKYVKVRTSTAEIHKKAKAFHLAGGRYVDAWKNTQLYASEGIEEQLKLIEDHYENIEKERIANLKAEREGLLTPYEIDVTTMDLGVMEDSVWDNFLAGTISAHEAKIAAEKKAEEDRLEKEREDAAERERTRIENERLKKEAAEHEAELKAERDKVAEIQRIADAEKKAIEDKAKAEREESEKKAAEEKRIADEKVAKEAAEKRELQAEIASMIECPACGHKFNKE